MPKDLIHFKVARMTADRLGDTEYAPVLDTHEPWLLLGSVFHDALFYGATRRARHMAELAHRLHGAHGQDTFRLIRVQAAHAGKTGHAPAAALLAGMVSHLFADTVMHPMVWHLSGHYYADRAQEKTQARQHHRALESLMDMVACPELLGRPLFSVRRLLTSVGTELFNGLPLDNLAEFAHVSRTDAQAGLRTAFRIYAGLQTAFSITQLARTLFWAMPFLPSTAREIAALFYAPQLMDQAHALQADIEYCHPVTGVSTSASLEAMMTEAADRAAALCRELEGTIFHGRELSLPEDGPSMDAGLSKVSTNAMRHFADSPFPKLP